MTYDVLGPGALDYLPCRYGASKLTFRGPRRVLEAPYVAFIGGTQTFGKFIEQPYPLRVEHLTGVTSVNFGQVNAGLDVFASDAVVQGASQGARVTVVEVLGAAYMSNPLYKVHYRRNDRFLRASDDLRQLYPEVDFAEFNFALHMLQHLFQQDSKRFAVVKRRLQRVWVRRMGQLLTRLGSPVVLLRFDAAGAASGPADGWTDVIGGGPAFVTPAMIAALHKLTARVIDVPSCTDGLDADGLLFNPLEKTAAQTVVGPSAHQAAADALRPVLDELM